MNQTKLNNDDMFLKIFRNIILRKEIFNQMKLLNKHEHYHFKSLKELKENKFKEYISNISFYNGFNDDNFNEETILICDNNYCYNDIIIKFINFGNSFNQLFHLTNFSCILIIEFGDSFNQKLSNKDMLPKSLTSLTLGNKFNQELIPFKSLPIGLKYLKLGNSFNQGIEIGSLPNELEILILGDSFKSIINPKSIPSKLKELEFGLQWNHSLYYQELYSLIYLEKLKFKCFNQPIYDEKLKKSFLPPNLKELRFILNFNKTISNGLPKSLRVLELGQHFSKQIYCNVLPYSLESLDLGKSYYFSIGENVLPNSLLSIKFSPCSLQDVVFTKNIKSISIGYYFKSLHSVGPYVESLEIDKIIPGIPNTIRNLKFSSNFNNLNDSITIIPSSIKSLDTGITFNQPLKHGLLSNSITSLTFGDSFNQPIEKGSISTSNVKHLKFGTSFLYPLDGNYLPCKLETLTLSKKYPKNYLKNISKSIKIFFI
ncbi:hypothetical protein RB653_010458 [Dictyostelium firmibasis]|uniref:FNIP repeat-containing protein n=1 Tax=Dictyostelium firmibasis TaxID=79012 RepID=A0AAN7TSW7_9MYCE